MSSVGRREAEAAESAQDQAQDEPNPPNRTTFSAQQINFDIASIIFMILWELEVYSELIVARVCRGWREAALANPRLWTRIYPDRRGTSYTSTYLARSHSLPLHVTTSLHSSDTQIAALSSVTDRILCLKRVESLQLLEKSFHKLERLEFSRIYLEDAPINSLPMPLEASNYPILRQIDMADLSETWIRLLIPEAGFPPLQSLQIVCDDRPHWRGVVTACAETLESLSLVILDPENLEFAAQDFEAVLPRLRHLRIKEECGKISLKLDAPCLQSVYRGVFGCLVLSVASLVLLDAKSVTDLEVRNTPVESPKYPGLRTLWIQFRVENFPILKIWLHEAMEACPLFERIRYVYKSMPRIASSLGDSEENLEEMIRNVILAADRPEITVERFNPEDPHLPGSPPRDATCNETPCTGQY